MDDLTYARQLVGGRIDADGRRIPADWRHAAAHCAFAPAALLPILRDYYAGHLAAVAGFDAEALNRRINALAAGPAWPPIPSLWERGEVEPRAWQFDALPAIVADLASGDRIVVQAVMGAGKSVLIAALCAARLASLGPAGLIVISTSSVALVEQLTIDVGQWAGFGRVGQFFGQKKQIKGRSIIVVCDDSIGRFAKAAARLGRPVELLIADECHKTECESYHGAMEALSPASAVGFTATPFRANPAQTLQLWDRLVFAYGPGAALRDGVVVPFRITAWEGGELDLDEAVWAMIQAAHDVDGPGVISASSVQDAEDFAAWLCARGFAATALHYQCEASSPAILEDLREGRIRAVVAVNILTEGVNLPWLRWLCLRRPMGSRVAFAQFVGRVLRAFPGKAYARILDPYNLFDAHRLDWEAALQAGAEVEPEPEAVAVAEGADEAGDPAGALRRRKALQARRLAAGQTMLLRIAVALSTCEVIDNPAPWGRRTEATARQLATLERHAAILAGVRGIPEVALVGLRAAYVERASLTKGQASDFLSVIFGLDRLQRQTGSGWPERATLLLES